MRTTYSQREREKSAHKNILRISHNSNALNAHSIEITESWEENEQKNTEIEWQQKRWEWGFDAPQHIYERNVILVHEMTVKHLHT